MSLLAEIPYPRIDPVLVDLGFLKVRWYGLSYIVAFVLAGLVLHGLAKRRRWPVEPGRVVDVLFWGILGVFVGGRLGWVLFYYLESADFELGKVFKVWEGGMSFHGGLLGVIVAYWIYAARTKAPRGDLFDGLALATAPGLLAVRLGNFINAELYGRVWDGPWAMRFPRYDAPTFGGPQGWEAARDAGVTQGLFTQPRHPSQLYEAFAEGLLLYVLLRWLMLRRGWGSGRISAAFLVLYGVMRFFIEFVRQPDAELGLVFLGTFTRGQQLCFGMVLAGLVVWALCRRPNPGVAPPESTTG